MNSEDGAGLPPQVVIFPYPVQGHVTPQLHLAHLLCSSLRLHVTLVVSDFTYRRLLLSDSAAQPGFRFLPISDGLPDDHPRGGERAIEVVAAVENTMVPLFKKAMAEGSGLLASADRRPVTCFVADGFLRFAADFAEETGIPMMIFRATSASSVLTYLHTTEIREFGGVPLPREEMDELVRSVPGMEGILRRRDMPSFPRIDNAGSVLQIVAGVGMKGGVQSQLATILNTFEEMEELTLSQLRRHVAKVYTVGPMHAHLNSRRASSPAGSSFRTGDQRCIEWLDAQPPKSVIYVSFGSMVSMTREQLMEFWHGLLNSGHKFLWVIRVDSIICGDNNNAMMQIPDEKRVFVVKWAPQEEVLSHPAVCACMNHGGWNTIVECIAAGVPMIFWPFFLDQPVNSRLLSEVCKVGLNLEDNCDRLSVETAVREVMKDEFQERADRMAKVAKKAVSKGGSSYSNLDSMIDHFYSLIA